MTYPRITLHQGRERSVLRRHPWLFSKAVASIDEGVKSGQQVQICAADGSFLAWGIYAEKSQITARLLSFKENEPIDDELIAARVKAACALRGPLMARGNDGVRLIAAEGDYLPGLIVDKYNDFIVLACSSYAAEAVKDTAIDTLRQIFPTASFYERSDSRSRLKEGLTARCGVISGATPPDILYVRENGQIYLPIDIKNGHKTGGYLDQRASRFKAGQLSRNARVLNCFSYTGGFGLWALKGGAKRVENIDVSGSALQHAKEGCAFNHLDPGRCRFIKEDVFAYLRAQAEKKEQYDLVILDPPKFAESQATLKKACRGYQDINRLGLQLVRPGGRLLTFSCSGLMDPALFQKICADAALDAGVSTQVISALRQDEDHVIALPCPESFYLKGLEIAVN